MNLHQHQTTSRTIYEINSWKSKLSKFFCRMNCTLFCHFIINNQHHVLSRSLNDKELNIRLQTSCNEAPPLKVVSQAF